jgi:peptidoglycan L-alanyl-D-glutamate endopeptidase CwlK
MFKFSNASQEKLGTCHRDLQTVMLVALAHSDVDFGIAEGHRSPKRQNELYKQGKTQIDGIRDLSRHNHQPSIACDIYAYVNGKANYSDKNMAYLAGVILCTATRLYEARRIKHKVRWGGNWDRWQDGADYDGFVDMPHFELII